MVNQQFSGDHRKFKGFKGFFQGWVKCKDVSRVSRVSRFCGHPAMSVHDVIKHLQVLSHYGITINVESNLLPEKKSDVRNTKIQSLLDEIINDSPENRNSIPRSTPKKIISTVLQVKPGPPSKMVAEVFPSSEMLSQLSSEAVLYQELPYIAISVPVLPKPRTKEDFVGYSEDG